MNQPETPSHYRLADEQKKRELPQNIIGFSVLIPLTLGIATYFSMIGEKMLPWYILTAAGSIVAKLADKSSTLGAIETLHRIDSLGIQHDIYETSVFVPSNPSKKDFFTPLKTTVDSIGLAAGVILPLVGIPMAILQAMTAMNNNQVRQELEKKIADCSKNIK